MRIFGEDELIGSQLQIEVWTDRGSDNLYFEEGAEVTLSVRLYQPAYVQLAYHLANDMRALLYENYYVDQAKVNHVVTLPDTFLKWPSHWVLRSCRRWPAMNDFPRCRHDRGMVMTSWRKISRHILGGLGVLRKRIRRGK